ncbi:leucine rich adaptor protein 1 [Corythoichthys intestinalis]|uniref:leucine rich adaptor protein 1 n=1 Tax=Corythoichthys intestinalis TaxID=161448 RepID=UPI0025A55E14|nr:leucine rich adaptor protein 1 [Corythoichthys intestinalis]XP_057696033.1 leucine rich adaptor protein 1 [Corythoichthys intestinalis]
MPRSTAGSDIFPENNSATAGNRCLFNQCSMTMMDEGTVCENTPDLKDIEAKIGRKTPEGLLRWMREEASSLRGEDKLAPAVQETAKETGKKSLDDKIRKLKTEMAYLRSADIKILQQLLAVHEGIEAVKWLLEERSTLTSRCSSLTSSQYSLGEGPDTSWRGSWSSLHDPNDKLDNISIGSYLDTLADDMDEYCPSSSDSVICSSTPQFSEATSGGRTAEVSTAMVSAMATGDKPGANAGIGRKGVIGNRSRSNENGTAKGTVVIGDVNGNGIIGNENGKPDGKNDALLSTNVAEAPVSLNNTQTIKGNGNLEKTTAQTISHTQTSVSDKLSMKPSPKRKPYKNGNVDLDTCKLNGKMHLEYDAHWRWVQSQEDVTFL